MLRPFLAPLLCLATIVAIPAEDAAVRDVIYRTGNQPPIQTTVESETVDGALHRMNATDKQTRLTRGDEILRIVYAGMEGGAWAKGVEARSRGDYDAAAEQFGQVVTGGQREWERVYGAFASGECLELAGKFEDAATAFDTVVQKYAGNAAVKPPIARNRRWLDAVYHKGVALALGGKADEAQKTAILLDEIGRKEALSAADVRAAAIRAVAAAQDSSPKFAEFFRKAAFRATNNDETEAWYHFKSTIANLLRTQKKTKEAVLVYRDMLAELPKLPPDRNRDITVTLGMAMCMATVPEQRGAALAELVRIDALPYGSPEQLCQARATAARLVWEDAKKITGDPEAMKDTRKADWAKEQEGVARFLASAAAAGPNGNASAGEAKTLLQEIGPAK